MLTRETVTFRDTDGWSWEFHLTFMLSNYQCIWGRGCPDTRQQHTARGCCVEGVEIYQGEGDAPGREDLKKVRGRVGEDDRRGLAEPPGGAGAWRPGTVGQGAVQARQRTYPPIPGRVHLSQPRGPSRRGRLCAPRCGAPPGRGPDGLEAADLLAGPAVLRHRRRHQDHYGACIADCRLGRGRDPRLVVHRAARTRSTPASRCT